MCFIARFDTVMTHLLSKSLRRDLFLELPENVVGETGGFLGGKIIQPTFMLSREFVSFIRPEALIAWIFSRRSPPTEGVIFISTSIFQLLFYLFNYYFVLILAVVSYSSWNKISHLEVNSLN